jgi:hypothetical protein
MAMVMTVRHVYTLQYGLILEGREVEGSIFIATNDRFQGDLPSGGAQHFNLFLHVRSRPGIITDESAH